MKRVCWMTLRCSAEPKRRYVAQIAVFAAKSEPLWLKDKMYPKGKKATFSIVQRRDTLKSRYLTAAFLSARRGVSYGITSRELVRQVPIQQPLTATLFRGLAPLIPPADIEMLQV